MKIIFFFFAFTAFKCWVMELWSDVLFVIGKSHEPTRTRRREKIGDMREESDGYGADQSSSKRKKSRENRGHDKILPFKENNQEMWMF